MIFLDETGKRWHRIKLGTGLLSTTTVTPVLVLLVASLLYLPSWGSFSLPTPFSTHEPQVKSEQTSQESSNPTSSGQPSSTRVPSQSSTESGSSLAGSSSQPSPDTVPSGTETTPTTTTPAATSTPTSQGQGIVNQPDTTGNSDYGRTHQPTRS
jgi:hypothetical protein